MAVAPVPPWRESARGPPPLRGAVALQAVRVLSSAFRRPCAAPLKPPRQIMHLQFQRLRNFCQRLNRDLVFRTLHVSDVIAREVRLLRELFLAPAQLFSTSL